MIELLERNRERIAELCRRHPVAKLDVFGSASTGDFDAERSDVDFLPLTAERYIDHYNDLIEGLRRLLDRPVDVITDRPFENWVFRQAVERSRRSFYAA